MEIETDFTFLNRRLKHIVAYKGTEVNTSEKHLPVLTAVERPVWADARNQFFSDGVNKESLDTIEKVGGQELFYILDVSQDMSSLKALQLK